MTKILNVYLKGTNKVIVGKCKNGYYLNEETQNVKCAMLELLEYM